MCGKYEWSREMLERFPECRPALWPELRTILAIAEGNIAELRQIAGAAPRSPFAELVAILAGEAEPDIDAARRCVEQIAGEPLMRINGIALSTALIRVVTAIDERLAGHDLLRQTSSTLREILIGALEWAAQRKLPPTLAMLLDGHEDLLSPRQRTHWRSVLDAIADERRVLFTSDRGKPQVTVSMIGTITATRRDAPPHRLRGERMRVLLALLVANEIITKPLSLEEFAAIATGIEDDPEAARLSLTHMIYRLRETIGAQMVITGGAAQPGRPPQLNLGVVEADLITAWHTLEQVRGALADGFLVRAARSLMEVIAMVRGEIVFPTLYDRFFEALRTDFGVRLRDLLLAVARRLVEEEDAEGAERLLTQGFAMMPEDADIRERLLNVLVRLGRHTEAERIRMPGGRPLKK
jgi:DNA-binding SARP family transcriptional activator